MPCSVSKQAPQIASRPEHHGCCFCCCCPADLALLLLVVRLVLSGHPHTLLVHRVHAQRGHLHNCRLVCCSGHHLALQRLRRADLQGAAERWRRSAAAQGGSPGGDGCPGGGACAAPNYGHRAAEMHEPCGRGASPPPTGAPQPALPRTTPARPAALPTCSIPRCCCCAAGRKACTRLPLRCATLASAAAIVAAVLQVCCGAVGQQMWRAHGRERGGLHVHRPRSHPPPGDPASSLPRSDRIAPAQQMPVYTK